MRVRGVRIRAELAAVLAGVLCLAAPALFASNGPRSGNPHAHFRNPDQCPKCHLPAGSPTAPDRFSTESDSVCLACHTKESLGRSHPVNVRPEEKYRKMKVPADLRLDEDGRIMCLTCHTAHGQYVAYFLRRSGPGRGFDVLCEACHGRR
jgi:predicted CXXCH cytochrome family protein